MENILEQKPNHIELIIDKDFQVKDTYNRVFNNLHKNSQMLLNTIIQYIKMNNYENYGIFPNFLNDFELTTADIIEFNTEKYIRLPYGLALYETNDLLNEVSQKNVIFYNYNDVIFAQRQISAILDIKFESDKEFVKIKNSYNKFKMHIRKLINTAEGFVVQNFFYGCLDELGFDNNEIEGVNSIELLGTFLQEASLQSFIELNFPSKDLTKIYLEETRNLTKLGINESDNYCWIIDRELNDFSIVHEDSVSPINNLKLNTFKVSPLEINNNGNKIKSIEEHITEEVKNTNDSLLSQVLGDSENYHVDITGKEFNLTDTLFHSSVEGHSIIKESIIPKKIDRALISFQSDVSEFSPFFGTELSYNKSKSFIMVDKNFEKSKRLCSEGMNGIAVEKDPIYYSDLSFSEPKSYSDLDEFLFGIYEDSGEKKSIIGNNQALVYLKRIWVEYVDESSSSIKFEFISTKENFNYNYDFIYIVIAYD